MSKIELNLNHLEFNTCQNCWTKLTLDYITIQFLYMEIDQNAYQLKSLQTQLIYTYFSLIMWYSNKILKRIIKKTRIWKLDLVHLNARTNIGSTIIAWPYWHLFSSLINTRLWTSLIFDSKSMFDLLIFTNIVHEQLK